MKGNNSPESIPKPRTDADRAQDLFDDQGIVSKNLLNPPQPRRWPQTVKKVSNEPSISDLEAEKDENGESKAERSDRITGSNPNVIASNIPIDQLVAEEPESVIGFRSDALEPLESKNNDFTVTEAAKARFEEIREMLAKSPGPQKQPVRPSQRKSG